MKRVIALLLALIMMLSMTTMVWATETGAEGGSTGAEGSTGGESGSEGGEGTGEQNPPAHTHDWAAGTAVAATCGADGYTPYTCSGCSETKQEPIPATGNHSWDGGVKTDPTCTTAGKTIYKCSVCSATKEDSIPAKGHTFTADTSKQDVEATCTAAGTRYLVCKECNMASSETIAQLDHQWDAGKEDPKATCLATGKKTLTCTVCKTTKTEDVPKTDHIFPAKGEITKEPTCAEEGEMTYQCTTSGCTEKKVEPIEKLKEHKLDKGTVTTQPTCVKKGVKTYKCTVEKCDYKEEEPIAMVSHSWDSGTITIEATITEKGLNTYKCFVCGQTQTQETPPLGYYMDPDELATLKAAPNNAYGAKLNVEPWVIVQAVLSEEELARVQSGWPFSVTLGVKNVTSEVTNQERQPFVEYADDDQILFAYLDVTLLKQLEGDAAQSMTTTAEMVDIIMDLPAGMPEVKKNATRSYMMLRLHDGIVEAVPTKLSESGEQIIFQTDKFSTYVLTYTDTREESSFPVLPVFIGLMLAALGGVAYLCKLIFIDHILSDDDDEEYDEEDYDEYEQVNETVVPQRSGRRLSTEKFDILSKFIKRK